MKQANDDRQRVLDATDIVQLIGESVKLRPQGREFKGLCPFHDDRNPSMFVAPHKGIFKCFACGAGGNAIDFAIRYHGMDFPEALKFLAERGGITLTPYRPAIAGKIGGGKTDGVSSSDLIEAHRTALSFYRTILHHNEHGRVASGIFTKRGINDAMIERFSLGAAPGSSKEVIWDGLVRTLEKQHIPLQPFLAAGLIQARKSGPGHIDRFRNRLIFPIHDEIGRPIAFGARQIDPEDEPKYLNSPEHAKFKKSRTMYGYHLARPMIQRTSTAIVVEGYTDVIACHQAGVENVVATLGTALTNEHARLLGRLCDRVVLVFDGDEAGQRAANRSVEIFFQSNVDLRFVVIPNGGDPADLLSQEDGVATFQRLIDESEDVLDFLLRTFREKLDSADSGISSRQRLVEAFTTRLGELGFHAMGPLRRDLVLRRLAELLGLDEQTLLRSIPKGRRHSQRKPMPSETPPAEVTAPSALKQAEAGLLGCLLHSPRLFEHLNQHGHTVESILSPAWFGQPQYQMVFERLAALPADERNMHAVIHDTDGPGVGEMVAGLVMRSEAEHGGGDVEITERVEAYLDTLAEYQHQQNAYDLTIPAQGSNTGETGSPDRWVEYQGRLDQIRQRGGNPRKLGRTITSAPIPTPAATTPDVTTEHDEPSHPDDQYPTDVLDMYADTSNSNSNSELDS